MGGYDDGPPNQGRRDWFSGGDASEPAQAAARVQHDGAPRRIECRRRTEVSTGGDSMDSAGVLQWIQQARRGGFTTANGAAMAITFGEGKPGRRAGQIKDKQGNLAAAR
jgi:hypothetical protein